MFRNTSPSSPDEDSDEEKADQAIIIVKRLFETAAANGVRFTVRLKSPREIVGIGKKLFAVVPQETNINVAAVNNAKKSDGSAVKARKYTAKSFILAISNDQGNTWKYWSAFSEASYEKDFPETVGKIKFPRTQTPSFLFAR